MISRFFLILLLSFGLTKTSQGQLPLKVRLVDESFSPIQNTLVGVNGGFMSSPDDQGIAEVILPSKKNGYKPGDHALITISNDSLVIHSPVDGSIIIPNYNTSLSYDVTVVLMEYGSTQLLNEERLISIGRGIINASVQETNGNSSDIDWVRDSVISYYAIKLGLSESQILDKLVSLLESESSNNRLELLAIRAVLNGEFINAAKYFDQLRQESQISDRIVKYSEHTYYSGISYAIGNDFKMAKERLIESASILVNNEIFHPQLISTSYYTLAYLEYNSCRESICIDGGLCLNKIFDYLNKALRLSKGNLSYDVSARYLMLQSRILKLIAINCDHMVSKSFLKMSIWTNKQAIDDFKYTGDTLGIVYSCYELAKSYQQLATISDNSIPYLDSAWNQIIVLRSMNSTLGRKRICNKRIRYLGATIARTYYTTTGSIKSLRWAKQELISSRLDSVSGYLSPNNEEISFLLGRIYLDLSEHSSHSQRHKQQSFGYADTAKYYVLISRESNETNLQAINRYMLLGDVLNTLAIRCNDSLKSYYFSLASLLVFYDSLGPILSQNAENPIVLTYHINVAAANMTMHRYFTNSFTDSNYTIAKRHYQTVIEKLAFATNNYQLCLAYYNIGVNAVEYYYTTKDKRLGRSELLVADSALIKAKEACGRGKFYGNLKYLEELNRRLICAKNNSKKSLKKSNKDSSNNLVCDYYEIRKVYTDSRPWR